MTCSYREDRCIGLAAAYHIGYLQWHPLQENLDHRCITKVGQKLKHREKTQKSINVKSLIKKVRFQQFSELDRISRGADVVGQSIPGGETRM